MMQAFATFLFSKIDSPLMKSFQCTLEICGMQESSQIKYFLFFRTAGVITESLSENDEERLTVTKNVIVLKP